ncbi:MAG: helix-turn-helix domain-containing protein [Ginsengibacter sp.]
MQQGIFGERLGRSFHVGDPPTLFCSTPGGCALAVTEIRSELGGCGFTEPFGHVDAYLVGLQLRGLSRHELWMAGTPVSVQPFHKGSTCFYDLQHDPVAYLDEPFHSLNFYFPREALSEVADELGQGVVDQLAPLPGAFIDDPAIYHVGQCLLPVMHGELRSNQLFVDHMMLALRGHLVSTYGQARKPCKVIRGGLAAWQQRKATGMIRDNLVEGIALIDLAQACRLSSSAFVRGFKQSLGVPPHQWLLMRRVDHAIELMRDRSVQLADVALSSGFADQSHFTRMFARKMGISPGAWRHASCH